jgi:peptide-methionine (S)-S-oxide reductase
MTHTGRRIATFGFFAAVAALMLAHRVGGAAPAVTLPAPAIDLRSPVPAATETAVFAGGCFWGIQSVFQHVKGVITATSGYSGGWVDRPKYDDVTTGRTGHAEAVRVVFDPSVISYGKLLEIFFSVAHDPTQLNRQGPDVGTQYRSALFYLSPEQKKTAESYIHQLNQSRVFSKPIATQVSAHKEFFLAEAYHQNYAENNPRQPYIMMYDAPKVANLKKLFAAVYTDKLAGHE